MAVQTVTKDDFESMLMDSFLDNEPLEGTVVKGKVVAIEKDLAIIDVGLKTEGRIALKEFGQAGRDGTIQVGSEVEVYVDRVENAVGEAVLSREKARREESWVKLEEKYAANERVEGIIFNQVKGGFTVDLEGAVAFLPRSQVDIRPIRDIGPLMNVPQPFQILKMDRSRGNIVVSRRAVLETGDGVSRAQLADVRKRKQRAHADLAQAWENFDFLLAPAAKGEAPAGLGNTGDPLFNRFWTLLGTPCIALPFNTGPFGLPLSLQLVGPLRDDDQLIAWARWVEQRLS